MGVVEESLTWLRWPDWEAESVPAISDLAVLPLFALGFLAIRFGLDKLVFEVGFMCAGLEFFLQTADVTSFLRWLGRG
jgi:hypothetical protein